MLNISSSASSKSSPVIAFLTLLDNGPSVTVFVPVTSFCSHFWYLLLILGVVLSSLTIGTILIYFSIAMFAAVVIFQTVTLPVEFDASSRALKTLANDGILEPNEVPHAAKVLKAAALTYVAGLVASILQLIRLLLSVRRR